MGKLSLLDLGFFLTETEASPKHVGSLMILRKPASEAETYADELYRQLIDAPCIRAPFNEIVRFSATAPPHWVPDPDFDIRNHIFRHRLPAPATEATLQELIGELHTPRMDRNHPIWEFHIIDGLAEDRCALYMRIHHAYADGMSMAGWLLKSLSKSPRPRKARFIWALPEENGGESAVNGLSATGLLRSLTGKATDQFRMWTGLYKLTAQLALEQLQLTRNAVALPYKTRHNTPLTGQVTAGRQIATATVPMERVNRIRRLTRSTLNHVALTCIDGALHRYLEECGSTLDEPITIQMPVNLRAKDDESRGNKIGIVLVDLAGSGADPYERLREIGFTLRNVRYQVDGVPPSSVMAYTMVLAVLAQLAELLKLSDALPPLGNTLVSNVPGPKYPLYLMGARLEAMFPISALSPGNHMNITLFSYDRNLHFGLVATRALPRLHRLADYIYEAFVELEAAVDPNGVMRDGARAAD